MTRGASGLEALRRDILLAACWGAAADDSKAEKATIGAAARRGGAAATRFVDDCGSQMFRRHLASRFARPDIGLSHWLMYEVAQ